MERPATQRAFFYGDFKVMPYVYWLKNITTGYKYIGARYAKGCSRNDFWVTYFTSSRRVAHLIETYGKEDFKFKILKEFETPYEALTYENNLILRAAGRKDYVNLHPNFLGSRDEEVFELELENQRKAASITGTICVLEKKGLFSLTEEEKLEVCSQGGYAAAEINKIRGTAIFDPDVRERQHKTLREKQVSAYYDPSLRFEISAAGGRNGLFSEAYAERNGISEEGMIERQRERGRKGGPKNKGFKWYNDGLDVFKYTPKMQLELSFEEFLEKNPQFKRGTGRKVGCQLK